MSKINMQNFLNTLWEFTGVKEVKGNFIQKELKVCKVFRVMPLKAPSLMFRTTCFVKTFER